MTRPTDADVDGMSAVYQASWRGPATFGWKGAEQGYIVRVTPKGYTPEPLPNYEKLSDTELVAALDSPSRIRTMAAQRALLRRASNQKTREALVTLAENKKKPLEARIAAVFAISQQGDSMAALHNLIKIAESDVAIAAFATRAFGDLKFADGKKSKLASDFINRGLELKDPRRQVEAMIAATRQGMKSSAIVTAIANHLGSDDPAVAHVAFRALAKLGASEACFAVLDSEKQGQGAAFALMRMHDPAVVNALISRLATEKSPVARKNIIATLCRLHHHEGEWAGQSWGTRPDTRGPYYQLETWSESRKILIALKTVLVSDDAGEVVFLVKEMNRNRIQSDDALRRVITMAATDESLIPDAVAQIAVSENMPEGGMPLVLKAARNVDSKAATLAAAIQVLAKSDDKEVMPSMLTALVSLDKLKKGSGKEYETGKTAFLSAPKLENHHLVLEKIAAGKLDSPKARWANLAVLELASRKTGSPESREMSAKAIDLAWKNSQHKILLMNVAAGAKNHFLDDRIRIAMNDPLPKVAKAAKKAAGRLKIQPKGADKTAKISTLDPKPALAEVLKHKGDTTLGESVFARATCAACHTTNQDQPQKGPYLGNIFETYKRPEIAEAILDPNKTIAQGFATNIITPKKGNPVMGFVTDEQGDQVTIRDIVSQEHIFKKSDIAKRDTLPISIMPPGLMGNFTVYEFASLLDYLQAMTKKK
ncbi:MAG: c-type cytochrome [Verrucomicrobia bacterium]|nr:c-type cytochrome [Verrucomicrobiota bacterium]